MGFLLFPLIQKQISLKSGLGHMQLRCEHSLRQHHTFNLLFSHNVSNGPGAYIRLHVKSDIRLHVGFTDARFSGHMSHP